MGSFRVLVALTWMVTLMILSSEAAPVTEFFGPSQIIENDQQLEQEKPKKVEEMERFHRTYKNGTVEFKMALSNGHVQYQRISSKIVDGDKVQVFEGYISEQYKDGRYGTRYYAADENGYRSSPVIVEDEPPKLPTSGPYSSSLSQDVQKALSPMNEDNTYEKPKTLQDNLIQIEKDLEEEMNNLNLGSTTETLDISKLSEEPLGVQNFNADLPEVRIDLDLPTTTELLELLSTTKFLINNNEAPEATQFPTQQEGSGNQIPLNEEKIDEPVNSPVQEEVSGNNGSLNEENLDGDKFEQSSASPIDEDLSGGNQFTDNTYQHNDNKKTEIEGTTISLLNDEITPTELSTKANDDDSNTSIVPQLNEIKTDGATSSISQYPLNDPESESTTLSPINEDEVTKVSTEQFTSEGSVDSSTEIPTSSIASVNGNSDENTSEEIVTSTENIELSTEKLFEGVSEATTEIFSNNDITSTAAPTTLSNELREESSTPEAPKLTEINRERRNDGSESTTLIPESETTEQNSEGSGETVTTDLPIESSTNAVDEVTDNNARSLNFLNILSLFDKKPTNGTEEDKTNSSNEETTAKIEISTEQAADEASSSSTISDITTESGVNLTTLKNDLENEENKTKKDGDITTDQPLTSTEDSNSSEEKQENSTENETSSNTSEKSSEEDDNTTSRINLENSSKAEEKEGKSIEHEITTSLPKESSEEDQSTEHDSKPTEIPSTSEEKADKSIEDEPSTELPEESSEEGDIKPSKPSSTEVNNETSTSGTELPNSSSEEEDKTTETEILSATEEITRGVEVEFAPPVIHF